MAEVFIRELTGSWAMNDDQGIVGIRFPSGHWAFPPNKPTPLRRTPKS